MKKELLMVDYDCGCSVEEQEDGMFAVTMFCEEHDPTVKA